MCKEHTLSRYTNLPGRNHPTLCFWLRRKDRIIDLIQPRMGKLILNHLIGNNCPESCNGLLYSYFFKLTLGSHCFELCFCTVAFKNILLLNLGFVYSSLTVTTPKANACRP